MIDNFKGKYEYLSNFYPCSISYEGINYPSIEHAYQAGKSLDILTRYEIKTARTAAAAKKIGQKIELRKDWEFVKLDIMKDLIELKFSHDPLRQMLIDTEDEELVEGNYWGDTYWGICRGEGENHLGKLLMSIREEIR